MSVTIEVLRLELMCTFFVDQQTKLFILKINKYVIIKCYMRHRIFKCYMRHRINIGYRINIQWFLFHVLKL